MSESPDDFPIDFCPQPVNLANAASLAESPPADIAGFFRAHPQAAHDLVAESSDKRWTPSTFIVSERKKYRVGWFSSKCEYECEILFDNLVDAATDYLLFSFGKGRWTPRSARILRNAVVHRGSPMSANALREVTGAMAGVVKGAYLQFLANSNGAEGDLGVEPGHIVFWRAGELLAQNSKYKIAELAPGFFGFASDGNELLFAFDMRKDGLWPIVTMSIKHLDGNEAVQVAPSFVALLTAFGQASPVPTGIEPTKASDEQKHTGEREQRGH
jgi:hypothetical protein